MRYNGVDIKTLGRSLSIAKGTLPQRSRSVETLETNTGILIGHVGEETGSYMLDVNIAGRTQQEAGESWLRLCSWAKGGGGVHALEVDELPLKAFDAIFEGISEPQLANGRGQCRIMWTLETPHPYSVIGKSAKGTAGTVTAIIGGTAETCPLYEIKLSSGKGTLSISVDGATVFWMEKSMAKGATIKIDPAREAVEVDGDDATADVDWMVTDWTHMLAPGKRTISAGGGAELTVRWHDRWG